MPKSLHAQLRHGRIARASASIIVNALSRSLVSRGRGFGHAIAQHHLRELRVVLIVNAFVVAVAAAIAIALIVIAWH